MAVELVDCVDLGEAPDPLIHLASPLDGYATALCGTPRNGRPLKPDAIVTCVVCLDLHSK